MIYISANLEGILSNLLSDTQTITYEYYSDNIIWHGPVYKKYIRGGWIISRVYTYDRQGNLISDEFNKWDLFPGD